jgi:hypothetical protein
LGICKLLVEGKKQIEMICDSGPEMTSGASSKTRRSLSGAVRRSRGSRDGREDLAIALLELFRTLAGIAALPSRTVTVICTACNALAEENDTDSIALLCTDAVRNLCAAAERVVQPEKDIEGHRCPSHCRSSATKGTAAKADATGIFGLFLL